MTGMRILMSSDTATDDYTGITNRVITFPAGAIEATTTVATTEDSISELPEQFTATLTNPTAGLTLGSDDTATVTINDDDGESKGFKKICMLSVKICRLLISLPRFFLC
jgi:hypothetical protein